MEIEGFDTQDDFDAAVAKWNAEHADEPSPMLEDAKRLHERDVLVATVLENLAHSIRIAGLNATAWSVDAPYECADSVVMDTGARQIDATVVAEFILERLRLLDNEWPIF